MLLKVSRLPVNFGLLGIAGAGMHYQQMLWSNRPDC